MEHVEPYKKLYEAVRLEQIEQARLWKERAETFPPQTPEERAEGQRLLSAILFIVQTYVIGINAPETDWGNFDRCKTYYARTIIKFFFYL